jgi:hypothetical protein
MMILRPLLSRVFAAWIAAFVVYLQFKFGITLDAETQAALLTVMLGSFTTIYAIAHKFIDRYINPGDAASSHLAVVEKAEVKELKTNEKVAERRDSLGI